MYSVYGPLHVDLDGDGVLDTAGVETQPNSTLRVYLQLSASGTTYYFPPKTLPGIPTSALSFITALVNAAKFNGSTKDLFGLVAGAPVYVTFDSSGVPTYQSTFTVPKSYEYFTSGDFDWDGYDDVELVSSDGSSDVIYGSGSGLGNPEGGVPRGFDFNGDGTEDVAITGMNSADATAPKRAYVLSTQDTPLFSDTSETDANFGRSVAWGDLDGDGGDELIVAAPGTSVHIISPTKHVAITDFSGCPGYSSRPSQNRSGIRRAQDLNGAARSGTSRSCSTPCFTAFATPRAM